MPSKRYYISLAIISLGATYLFITFFRNLSAGVRDPNYHPAPLLQQADHGVLPHPELIGHAIAPKLGNETAKAELGRAAWKLLHTTMARFPDKPTADESATLKSYIYLFQRLYPCGECATHFGELLQKFPPQVSSRSAAAAWACHVHNQVNKSLKKEIFDCANIGDFYDCGCAEDEEGGPKSGEGKKKGEEVRGMFERPEMSDEAKEKMKDNGRDLDVELLVGVRDV